jgi:eukaryotic-like serine/threonine-protein kinase
VVDRKALPHAYGRYELLARLGSGGMAAVYLARARGLGGFEREVAIKITHAHLSDESDFVASLLQEARIAARIRHPNVVPVLDVGEEENEAFLVMDYVEGEVLSAIARGERAAGGRVPLPVALRILADALSGLHAAHELRDDTGTLLEIVHRDFSPQNILVGVDGLSRLTDFGIARVASASSSTKSGFIKGKLGYLSPEQVRSPRNIDRRTDVWAAGVVAWELVTGQQLRARDDEAATLLRIVSEEPPRPRTVRDDVPHAVDETIAHALRMDPQERLGSADELRKRLLDAAGAGGTPVADASEVAEYVSRVAGEKLRERRRTIGSALAHGTALPVEEPQAHESQTRAELVTTPLAIAPLTKGGRIRWALAALALVGVGAGVVFVVSSSRTTRAAATTSMPAPSESASASGWESASASPSASASAMPLGSATALPHGSRPPPHRTPPPARPASPVHAGRPALPTDPLDDAR